MHNSSSQKFLLSSIGFAVLITCGGARAQSVADEQVPTVVISASADASAEGLPKAFAGGQVARGGRLGLLGNVDMMDAPFNTTNYTHALIEEQQARGVADVLQNDPSVRVARGFGNYQELYVMRGFAVSSDDLAYNGLFGLLPRQFVAAEFLERVEVFRGANSFLNGAAPGGGGIGGSINLVPKRAGNDPLTQFTLGTESGGQTSAAIDLARRFGNDNRAGVRINAARRQGDSAVDREHRELDVLAIGLDFKGDNFRLSADLGYQDHDLNNARPSVTLAAGVPVPAAPDAHKSWAQNWTKSGERDTFGTLRGEVDLGKDTVAWAALGARRSTETNILAAPTVTNALGDATMYRFDNARQDQVRTGEIGVRGTVLTGQISHKVSATLSGYAEDSRNAYALSNFLPGFATSIVAPIDVPAPAADFFTGGKVDAPMVTRKSALSSVALADTIGLVDGKLLVTLGARYQRIRDNGFDYTTGSQISHYDEGAMTPMAGVVFKVGMDVSVYANYIEGLQQGAVASGNDIDNVGEIFAPFKSRQKEVGVKYSAGGLGVTAALFTTSQPSAYVQNRRYGVYGEQRHRGLELSAFGMPQRGLRLLGGLTLLDTEQVSTAGGINQGNDVIGVPRTQVNAGIEWDVPQLKGLSLSARALHTARQFADAGNSQRLPSWSRLDLGLNYLANIAGRDITLRARVDNVFDRNYWASAGGYPGAGYLVLAAPRTAVLSASIDW